MSSLGAIVGFTLVFVLIAWALSALIFLMMRVAGPALRQLGAAGERRITALAAALPVVAGATVVGALILSSIAGADHCPVHDHHAHLCLTHGDDWASRPFAVALVSAAIAVVAIRLSLFAGALLRGRRAVAQLRSASVAIEDVRLVESDRPFCFVAGVRKPEIYASSAAWRGIVGIEREAMIAHERAHVRHRDLAWRAAIEVLCAFSAPHVSSSILARWDHATERLRDGEAADAVGSPESVAGAIVSMCRLGTSPIPAGATGFAPARAAIVDRVESLLMESPRGDRAAAVVATLWVAVVATMVASVAVHVEPLHHALESLLG